ncbi:MAG: dihydroorotate dehydrogenase (quinone) [Ferrovum sp. 37-45-19]|uniref:quinone-dependent dihydroorotate dehydrogenase n=1 Tax=Ferrovum sp. JA12 TaxID=1356299 RepID=UPI00070349A9|nr:quinone-dependent dihydroorotate dehydrogenase [Ferrovum sp. JA12]OYV79311.1 MAG: dihydroorotate dehydrogenase (quinone) [Ferrovum sp. 21-44-67]OYV94134.1 MAG: dihydroorotate dehydrogenase (quinone) [Ferrovum sp. 37-45-19]OZB34310.1 MAG: dihydroorotate dehydrogenase (quinone) [Ferrovum sp. 34-44-207]HQT81400.1 quinone-dependent dihydroorotate dehydrogenase [Ferrovaceae bacterium]HQU06287.1 quinone-dependent dihydroorotate dehydrogenase [Ferrovaceae bacterium]
MLYQFLRPLLFSMDPESAHLVAMMGLNQTAKCKALHGPTPSHPVNIMGIPFPNPLGIAAGLDKNAEYLPGLASLGVGFIEVGTVTPRAQPGNPKPRMFRLIEEQGIINRLGFNNTGVEHLLENIQRAHYRGVLGINIGKNFDTPLDKAHEDYAYTLERVYTHAHYITINISSPNTAQLRQLQLGDELIVLLRTLSDTRKRLSDIHQRVVPMAVKIAPDLTQDEAKLIADQLLKFDMDAIIATNTTIDHSRVQHHPHGREQGGLSGAPLFDKSLQMVSLLNSHLGKQLPIMGVGGITSPERARSMMQAGASLIQLYSGLIFQGPALIHSILKAL